MGHHGVMEELDALRAELADLAFALDTRGQCEAADVANATAERIREIQLRLGPTEAGPANPACRHMGVRPPARRPLPSPRAFCRSDAGEASRR